MKKLILIAALINVSLVSGQAFTGNGDKKFQVGANIQNNGTGISATYDFGAGENISFGLSSIYLLSVNSALQNNDGNDDLNADITDRFDLRARFNANLGSVINIDDNLDVYPGLSLGLKNFGGHLGVRYFFSDGFGVYSELNTPFAKYKNDNLTPAEKLNNQFSVSFGASFNI
ncbi:DUF6646 family protein [Seonamhaeicola marinus]|uniref:Porin family protein n=1 Tax=Seonamhaeicola marinus TaxID=1912246 RepID=A0A5D0HS06_9FLAO|nr:DUF6646 family protein [Seonamhaeicola marinus]TYA73921.1 porin family protein [Seonamhaeicola marinus]